MLYPTFGYAVEDALRRAPGLDSLSLIPIDCIHEGEQGEDIGDGLRAWLWGVSRVWHGGEPGPGSDPSLDLHLPTCPAMTRLVSRRMAIRHSYDEQIQVGEDHDMLLRHLADHQRGDAQCWLSMSSDWMLIDRTTPTSAQHMVNQADHVGRLKQRVAERGVSTSVNELPTMYPEMMQRYGDKVSFARRVKVRP